MHVFYAEHALLSMLSQDRGHYVLSHPANEIKIFPHPA